MGGGGNVGDCRPPNVKDPHPPLTQALDCCFGKTTMNIYKHIPADLWDTKFCLVRVRPPNCHILMIAVSAAAKQYSEPHEYRAQMELDTDRTMSNPIDGMLHRRVSGPVIPDDRGYFSNTHKDLQIVDMCVRTRFGTLLEFRSATDDHDQDNSLYFSRPYNNYRDNRFTSDKADNERKLFKNSGGGFILFVERKPRRSSSLEGASKMGDLPPSVSGVDPLRIMDSVCVITNAKLIERLTGIDVKCRLWKVPFNSGKLYQTWPPHPPIVLSYQSSNLTGGVPDHPDFFERADCRAFMEWFFYLPTPRSGSRAPSMRPNS